MAGIDWQVTGQRQTERLQPSGKFVKVVEVSVETSRGTTATFDIPDARYNAEYVRAVIQEWVDRESAVSDLSG